MQSSFRQAKSLAAPHNISQRHLAKSLGTHTFQSQVSLKSETVRHPVVSGNTRRFLKLPKESGWSAAKVSLQEELEKGIPQCQDVSKTDDTGFSVHSLNARIQSPWRNAERTIGHLVVSENISVF